MKSYSIIFVFFIISLVAQSQEREQLTIPLSDSSKEGKLNINLVTGSIKIIGYAGKDVIVDAVVKEDNDGKKGKERPDGMKRISSGKGFEITAVEKSNKINVGVSNPNLDVSFTIKVPQKFAVKASTVNDGNVIVENVHGNLEISNVNGDIKMKNVAGSVSANTINGDIVVNLTSITPNTPMAFSNLNGQIDVTFPPTLKCNLKLKTDDGEILSDFDIDVDKTPAKVNQSVDKEKGMYKINKEAWTFGKINGGGAEIMMKSMNGDIIIRKQK